MASRQPIEDQVREYGRHGAVQALTYTGRTAFGSKTGATLLSRWIGAFLLGGYAIAIAALAVRTTVRRDIT